MRQYYRLKWLVILVITSGLTILFKSTKYWFWFEGDLEQFCDTLGVTESFHTRIEHTLRDDDNGTTFEGYIRCDTIALTCLFGNIFYSPIDKEFSIYLTDLNLATNYTGAFIQTGIGSPSEYYYVDTWTFGTILKSQPLLVNQAWRRIEVERNLSPTRRIIPIYVRPMMLEKEFPIPHRIIEKVSIFFAILWPNNFFRTLYAGAAALYTLYEWNAIAPASSPTILPVLLDENLPLNGYQWFYSAFNPKGEDPLVLPSFSVHQGHTLFRTAVFGLSIKCHLKEIDHEFYNSHVGLWTAAFRFYSDMTRRWLDRVRLSKLNLKLTTNNNSTAMPMINEKQYHNRLLGVMGPITNSVPRVILIVRRDNQRKIINLDSLLTLLRRYKVSLEVVAFEDYSFQEQLKIIGRADILIAVHGAALAHIFFMRPGALVIEIFPYGFRKSIYRNLAGIFGIKYTLWQCPRQSCSKHNGKLPLQSLESSSNNDLQGTIKVDWNSTLSKDYWRNQDILIDLNEFERIIDLSLSNVKIRPMASSKLKPFASSPPPVEKFLMYLPWEQLNNQLIGFKSACAIAHFTNRTLVVPPIGFRKPLNDTRLAARLATTARTFSPREYEWRSFTSYFDSKIFQPGLLPCRTIPFDAFVSITRKVGVLLMRRLGQSTRVNFQQLADFYHHIATLEYEKVAPMPVYFPISFTTGNDVGYYLKRYERDRILCVGTMFWMYSFGTPLDYPMRGFQSKLDDNLYRTISLAINVHPDIITLANSIIPLMGKRYNAIHLRRGDYGQKCFDEGMGGGGSQEETTLKSCYQSPAYLIQRIRQVQREQGRRDLPWFIATNDPTLEGLMATLHQTLTIRIITMSTIIKIASPTLHSQLKVADPIELSLLDQLLAAKSKVFIGNYFSSFTRTIVEMRELSFNLTSIFF